MIHFFELLRYLSIRLSWGDPDAFTEIFSAYYKDLVMFAFSIIKDMASSEETVQDTFLKLWEDHANLDVKNSLKSMLLKSIHNRWSELNGLIETAMAVMPESSGKLTK